MYDLNSLFMGRFVLGNLLRTTAVLRVIELSERMKSLCNVEFRSRESTVSIV